MNKTQRYGFNTNTISAQPREYQHERSEYHEAKPNTYPYISHQNTYFMYNMLLHAHSGTRWLTLIFLVAAIAIAWSNWSKKANYPAGKTPLLGLIFTHVQLVLGLGLYFISPKVQFASGVMKDTMLRFYTVEHIIMMLIAIVLITIGYSKAKRQAPEAQGHKTVFTYYLIGLLLILVSIPWPFRNLGAGWF